MRLSALTVTGNENNDDFTDFKKQLQKKGLLEQLDFTGGDMKKHFLLEVFKRYSEFIYKL